ncbi:hypothetical protein DL96DRAFT_696561 [Flagelloscypha sp. PMI_526]|nr:hypothetical protein DL96DRAFT_696561 [Flagelloscypha sp. PMI_526]
MYHETKIIPSATRQQGSHFNILASELVSLILAGTIHERSHPKDVLDLTRVNRRLRRIAFSTPACWAILCFDLHKSCAGLAGKELDKWVERSKNEGLRVTLCCSEDSEESKMATSEILASVLPVAQRLVLLDLSVPHIEYLDVLWEDTLKMRQLQIFRLTLEDSEDDEPRVVDLRQSSHLRIFNITLPHRSRDENSIHVHLEWHAIEELRINVGKGFKLPIQLDSNTVRPIHAEKLRILEVTGNEQAIKPLFNKLEAKNIESFTMKNVWILNRVEALRRFLFESRHTLNTISFDSCPMTVRELRAVLEMFSTRLTNLVFRNCGAMESAGLGLETVIFHDILAARPTKFLPKLRKLVWGGDADGFGTDWTVLRQALDSREDLVEVDLELEFYVPRWQNNLEVLDRTKTLAILEPDSPRGGGRRRVTVLWRYASTNHFLQ